MGRRPIQSPQRNNLESKQTHHSFTEQIHTSCLTSAVQPRSQLTWPGSWAQGYTPSYHPAVLAVFCLVHDPSYIMYTESWVKVHSLSDTQVHGKVGKSTLPELHLVHGQRIYLGACLSHKSLNYLLLFDLVWKRTWLQFSVLYGDSPTSEKKLLIMSL